MSDYISRADAIEEISKGVWNVHELIDRIKALPSADAVDVAHDIPEYCSWSQTYTNMVQSAMSKASAEAVQGEWIMHIDDLFPCESTQECSVCHAEQPISISDDNFCPNCGAKMKGGDSE